MNYKNITSVLNERHHEKTGFLPMRKQCTDQLYSAVTAPLFSLHGSTIPLLLISEISCYQRSSVAAQVGLCLTSSE